MFGILFLFLHIGNFIYLFHFFLIPPDELYHLFLSTSFFYFSILRFNVILPYLVSHSYLYIMLVFFYLIIQPLFNVGQSKFKWKNYGQNHKEVHTWEQTTLHVAPATHRLWRPCEDCGARHKSLVAPSTSIKSGVSQYITVHMYYVALMSHDPFSIPCPLHVGHSIKTLQPLSHPLTTALKTINKIYFIHQFPTTTISI